MSSFPDRPINKDASAADTQLLQDLWYEDRLVKNRFFLTWQ